MYKTPYQLFRGGRGGTRSSRSFILFSVCMRSCTPTAQYIIYNIKNGSVWKHVSPMDNKRPCCLPTKNVTMSSEYFGPYTPHQRLWKINSLTQVITWRRRWLNRRILPKVCLIINTSKESMFKVLRVFHHIRVFCHIYIHKYIYIYTYTHTDMIDFYSTYKLFLFWTTDKEIVAGNTYMWVSV